MGSFFSNLFNKVKPPPPPPPTSPPPLNPTPEVKALIEEFQKQYPEIITATNNLSTYTESQRVEIQTKAINEINKVPVPTVNQFYTFMISLIKQYNIKVQPTDAQIQDLMQKFMTKYPGIISYMANIQGLSDAQQLEANTQAQTFMNSYPLGTEDDLYKITIDIFKKYNLPVPTLEQAQTQATTDASGNVTGFKDYGKISMKMEPFMNKRSLVEKEYSSFSR